MSRRGYDTSEIYEEREHERDYYAPRDHSRRTVYEDEIEIRERRRVPEREPEFLREDYGRREAGPLVLREEVRERSRERPRRREAVEEVIIARGPREKENTRGREFVEDEVIVARSSPIERERPRERPLPPRQVRQEREEYIFRAPPIREPSPARTEISIRERERERPQERDYREEEIIIRRDEKERERPRGRDYREEQITIRRDEKERDRPRGRDSTDEEIIIKREERSRGPPRERQRGFEKEEIIISDRDKRRPRAASYERESLTVSTSERERPRARSRGDGGDDEQIIIRRGEGRSRAGSRGGFRERNHDDIIFQHDEYKGRHEDQIIIREPSPDRTEISIREKDRERPRDSDYREEEIVIRRDEKESAYREAPMRDLGPVRAPPIVQEIITHHRHIDHGRLLLITGHP